MRKLNVLLVAVTLLFSGVAFAEVVNSTSGATNAGKAMTQPAKKDRKKKVEMCAECGKPESECDCEGEHKGHTDQKKDEKKGN